MKRIAIISPSGVVNHDYVHAAMANMERWGLEPVLMPHAIGHEEGRYGSSLENRLADLRQAITDDSFDTILCTRGGYGCVQLLPHLSPSIVAEHPKPIIGFSDITVLHALWHKAGVPSIHGSMVKHIAVWDEWQYPGMIRAGAQPGNRTGEVTGTLVGGNWAVLSGLVGTPYDMLDIDEGSILFLEDVGEAVYRVDRLFHQLVLSGVLDRVGGLVFGAFTDYHPDVEFPDMEAMLRRRLEEYLQRDIPVAFGMPIGHVAYNKSVEITRDYTLRVEGTGASLFPADFQV